ncbi:hypothetical protein [Caulobacter sp. BK020]|uniref:hypothetical protein n=1 Tax=Caulobacter sp. BK020 TaxID=2512117 RepID=UPI001048D348|nr:hypothetical protein [Caulobacter sp. BK020]
MIWQQSWRADPFAREIADRHYSRQTVGATQFVATGSCVVFKALTATGRAYWVTGWPKAEWVKHAWAGAWMCAAFRNEGAGLSSDLIRQAVAATRAYYGEPPSLGMVTFVDAAKTARGRSRTARPGQCFLAAGFDDVGQTAGGLHALQMLPEAMPAAEPAIGAQQGRVA